MGYTHIPCSPPKMPAPNPLLAVTHYAVQAKATAKAKAIRAPPVHAPPARVRVTRTNMAFWADQADPAYDKMVRELAWGEGPLDMEALDVPDALNASPHMFAWRWGEACVMSEANFNAAVNAVVVGRGKARGRAGGGWAGGIIGATVHKYITSAYACACPSAARVHVAPPLPSAPWMYRRLTP